MEIPLAALTALVLVRKRSCCVNRRSCNHKQRNKTGLIREQGHCNTHREREGFGGEKAVRCAASLPVPLGASTCSEVKQSRASWHWLGTRRRGAEMRWGLSAKKREDPSYFRGSHSHRPAPAAELSQTGNPYLAPAPCRTQGVWGAADTPPASLPVTHCSFLEGIRQHLQKENRIQGEKRMAEREGFEPSERFPPRRFSKPVLSATQPSLR